MNNECHNALNRKIASDMPQERFVQNSFMKESENSSKIESWTLLYCMQWLDQSFWLVYALPFTNIFSCCVLTLGNSTRFGSSASKAAFKTRDVFLSIPHLLPHRPLLKIRQARACNVIDDTGVNLCDLTRTNDVSSYWVDQKLFWF